MAPAFGRHRSSHLSIAESSMQLKGARTDGSGLPKNRRMFRADSGIRNLKLTNPASPSGDQQTGEMTVRNAVLLQQAMVAAMVKAGPLAHGEITAICGDLASDRLSGIERLTAIASTIASITLKRHAAEADAFLRCLQDLTRPTSGFAQVAERRDTAMRCDHITVAARRLDSGFDRLARNLADAAVTGDQAAAVEIVAISADREGGAEVTMSEELRRAS